MQRLRETFTRLRENDATMSVSAWRIRGWRHVSSPNDTRPEHWFNRADKAMYAAKRAGHNQFVLWRDRNNQLQNIQ